MEQERREITSALSRTRALGSLESEVEVRQPAPGKAAVVKVRQITADDRRQMIAEAAFLRAEQRGFAPGGDIDDWLAAEAEVDALLTTGDRQA